MHVSVSVNNLTPPGNTGSAFKNHQIRRLCIDAPLSLHTFQIILYVHGNHMRRYETQALVIGGGATGCGVLRDLSLRGISAILVERDDLASGATGCNHGLLHSGARYAVKDPESAKECIHENRILKKIARHCVEPTGGLFIGLPSDDPGYADRFVKGCTAADIHCRPVSVKEALRMEPSINPALTCAFTVPDGAIDPFRLSSANALDAKEHGGSCCCTPPLPDVFIKEPALTR